MIKNKKDYVDFLRADKKANKFGKLCFLSPIYRYLRLLRMAEYYYNCNKLLKPLVYFLFKHESIKNGITIGLNCFGKGLYIPHYGCIVVNSNARFGADCVIQCGTNVSDKVVGGNHIYLGAGAKILTGVKIANDVIVGANAVVTKSIHEENTVWAGIPAKKISDKGFASNRDFI